MSMWRTIRTVLTNPFVRRVATNAEKVIEAKLDATRTTQNAMITEATLLRVIAQTLDHPVQVGTNQYGLTTGTYSTEELARAVLEALRRAGAKL